MKSGYIIHSAANVYKRNGLTLYSDYSYYFHVEEEKFMSNKNGLTGVQQFIISTLTNAFQDNSNRSVSEKLARAAITSIPESININTSDMYNKVANQYPSLELSKTNQPKDVLDMSRLATQNVIDNDTQLRTVAYYIKK